MFKITCIMHFLCSSSVCVLPRYFFPIVLISNYCISILTVLCHTVSLINKYIDMSNKLDIPPHPNIAYKEICHSTKVQYVLINTFIPQGSKLLKVTFIMLQCSISNKGCSCELSIHQIITSNKITTALVSIFQKPSFEW